MARVDFKSIESWGYANKYRSVPENEGTRQLFDSREAKKYMSCGKGLARTNRLSSCFYKTLLSVLRESLAVLP